MEHAPDISTNCLLTKHGACSDPDCECTCHRAAFPRVAPPEVDDEWVR
jgi:hypothetical protein